MRRESFVTGVVAAIAALTCSAPPNAPSTPPETARASQPAPLAPIVLDELTPAPITEPPARSDGLDAADSCAPFPRSSRRLRFTYPPLRDYVERRRAALEPFAHDAALRDLGAAVRAGLDVPATAPPIEAPRATRLALSLELALGAANVSDDAALTYATRVIAEAPGDPLGYVLVYDRGLFPNEPIARGAILRAFRAAPREPELAWVAAEALWRTDPMRALEAADAYLDTSPDSEGGILRARIAALAHALAGGTRRVDGRLVVLVARDVGEDMLDALVATVRETTALVASRVGHPITTPLHLYVFSDEEARSPVACRTSPLTIFTRAGLDSPEGRAQARDEILRATWSASLDSAWPVEAPMIAHEMGVAEDVAAYRRLARRGAWIPTSELWRPSGSDRRRSLAAAERRLVVEWIYARVGSDVIRHVARPRSIGQWSDPAPIVERMAGTPIEDDTLQAFLAERLASARGR